MQHAPDILSEGKRLKAMNWHELVAVAKRNRPLAPIVISIILNDADARGESDAVAAAQYCLDTMADDPTGCFDELDGLLRESDRFERVQTAASYYPGNELPDDVFFAITGEAA